MALEVCGTKPARWAALTRSALSITANAWYDVGRDDGERRSLPDVLLRSPEARLKVGDDAAAPSRLAATTGRRPRRRRHQSSGGATFLRCTGRPSDQRAAVDRSVVDGDPALCYR